MPGLILNYTAMQDPPFGLFSFANHCYERHHKNKAADNMHTLNIPTLNANVIDNTTQWSPSLAVTRYTFILFHTSESCRALT